jgi:hypothetical protein
MFHIDVEIQLQDEVVYLNVTRATEEEAIAFARERFPEAIEIEVQSSTPEEPWPS